METVMVKVDDDGGGQCYIGFELGVAPNRLLQ